MKELEHLVGIIGTGFCAQWMVYEAVALHVFNWWEAAGMLLLVWLNWKMLRD